MARPIHRTSRQSRRSRTVTHEPATQVADGRIAYSQTIKKKHENKIADDFIFGLIILINRIRWFYRDAHFHARIYHLVASPTIKFNRHIRRVSDVLFLIFDFFELFALFLFFTVSLAKRHWNSCQWKWWTPINQHPTRPTPNWNAFKLFIKSHIHSVSLWTYIYMRIWHFGNSARICVPWVSCVVRLWLFFSSFLLSLLHFLDENWRCQMTNYMNTLIDSDFYCI